MTVNPSQCYECEICHNVNHYKQFTCHTCGAIPRFYSIVNAPAIIKEMTHTAGNDLGISNIITVHVAFGCERQISRRTIRRIARTVPMDYYAESKE